MKAYTITDVGKVRTENQDCVWFFQNAIPKFDVLALCDGMGGARAGSVASDIALSAFMYRITESLSDKKNKTPLPEQVRQAAEYSNEAVYEQAGTEAAYAGMGTTLVAAVFKGRQCSIVNVGDSRAYLISAGVITQITRDHSFVEDMVSRGSITREQARTHPRKNVITRALGAEETVECDVFTPDFRKNDILLLCSDGLSNTLADSELLEILVGNKKLEDMGKALLELALSRGAPDNVTLGLLQK